MIIVAIVFILCLYVAGAIGNLFKLRNETAAGLCMWIFLFAMCSIFYGMSLAK